jgi:hypothetical protein
VPELRGQRLTAPVVITKTQTNAEDLRLAEEAGMVAAIAPEIAPEVEEGDGLEQLMLPELREKGQARGVEPVGIDRDRRRRELWVEALRAAATESQNAAATAAAAAAARAAAAPAQAATKAAKEAYFA